MKKLLYSVSTALLLLSCNTEDPSLEAEPGKGGNLSSTYKCNFLGADNKQ